MRGKDIDVTTWTAGPPERVFELLADTERWPEWSPHDDAHLVSEGNQERDGVGAVRLFRAGRTHSREEVVEFERPRRLAYVLLSGLPIRGYRAEIDLTPAEGGTTIRWHSTFRPKVAGTGWIYRFALGRFITDTASRLATHAAAPLTG
ncbi:MAG: hypothetical protein QOG64_1016 [Acidimicrobiaceae bacterium]|nr:hypothetical protein [Acidimicrobiaceae bacterium]